MTIGVENAQGVRLEGQVALVTGGGRGLGRAMALALGASGASVAVLARSADAVAETVRQIEGAGGRALALTADVGDRQAVEAMVSRTERDLGPITLLVNNAGVGEPVAAFVETDPDAWWRNLEINLRGPVYCSHAVLPGMLARGRGRIINLTSGFALLPVPMMSAYAVSKAALQRFTETLAPEVAPHGVRVFALDPGLVRTAMVEMALHSGVPRIERIFRTFLEHDIAIPPERAAGLVVWIASGAFDSLHGRFLDANLDPESIRQRAAEIVERDLYVLRGRV